MFTEISRRTSKGELTIISKEFRDEMVKWTKGKSERREKFEEFLNEIPADHREKVRGQADQWLYDHRDVPVYVPE